MFDSAALAPTAVHLSPVVFAPRASYPIAVLSLAVVLASKENVPRAVFLVPVVFAPNANLPTATL